MSYDAAHSRIYAVKTTQSTTLDLSGLGLTAIPPELFELEWLTALNLGAKEEPAAQAVFNFLEDIPPDIARLKNLTTLSLSHNKLSTLPAEIGQLAELEQLDVKGNKLGMLPATIGGLTALQSFELGWNKLEELPDEMANLHSLRSLDLSWNQLKQFPSSLTRLSGLETLDISYNQLTALPTEMTRLTDLTQLVVEGNPLVTPPEILGKNFKTLLNYFAELVREAETDHLFEVKLLLIGEERAGKTSIAKKLALPGYNFADEKSTEGIDIFDWVIPKAEFHNKKMLINGRLASIDDDFHVHIWDFGGQEIYHATHQFFLTRRSIYIYVTESRREARHDEFFYWLNMVQLLGGHSPVIVIVNKCDLPTHDLPISEYRRHFATIIDYLKVSCVTGYGDTLTTLKKTVKGIITNPELLPHIGAPLPKVWVDIRHRLHGLRAEKRPFIGYDEYLQICAEYGMDGERAAYLADFFHDLGVFLCFRDDLDLGDTIFLDHEWVTDGVYRVLDYQKVIEHHGFFTDRDLRNIWGDTRYAHKMRELLSLMRRFYLCYPLPDKRGEYIAPQLLPRDAPDFSWRTQQDNLHFQFRYQFMPKGILSRLIVKMHGYIFGQTHWRYGVLLEYEQSQAIVRERYFEKLISIQVEGANKKEFLGLIRQHIREINTGFHGLQVEEMVPCNCETCRNSETPFLYEHTNLQKYLRQFKRATIVCNDSGAEIAVRGLLDDVQLETDGYGEDESHWRMTQKKLALLRNEYILATDPSEKFKLEYQIKALEAQLRSVGGKFGSAL